MITLKEWMELVNYRITDGSEFQWRCYGPNAYILDSWNGENGEGGYSFSIVFDRATQTVFEVSICDYTRNHAYRMINSDYHDKYWEEAEEKNVNQSEAYEGVDYVDLETVEDFMEKGQAIRDGKDYDDRVIVPLDISDADLLKYMMFAHKMDITFNELVERALRSAIEDIDNGSLTHEEIQKLLQERYRNANQTGQ
jgi:hypothetical protein